MTFTLSEVLILLVPSLAVVLLIAALVFASSARHSKRYRPGRPFEFRPVWFLAAPERLAGKVGAAALPDRPGRRQLPAGHAGEPVEGPLLAALTEGPQEVGGASDRW
ncbi:MAG: hypothetical protein IRY92_06470 [Dactylosporangium sp.]|nr:hypothetical protein [Dactylosporangium sp.]